ncbi:MAG: hypothetical protein WDA08_11980 [Weeksellaceae bacterium]
MKVTQLYTLINAVTKEVLGETAVVNEDLSNVVDIGKAVIDQVNGIDNYVRKLVDHIGKVVFVNRAYAGGVPSVLMDSWEFGSILEKISTDLPDATENDSWNLQDGTAYSQDTFYQPKVEAKFFNSKVTFEIKLSFTERQVKSAFSSAEQLNGFISMLVQSVENSMTVKTDALIMRAINNMIAETLFSELYDEGDPEAEPPVAPSWDWSKTGVRAVNLLALYNETVSTPLTVANAITSPDFIRFATYQISLVSDRMTKISTLFNTGGKQRFTPADVRRVVLLSDFAKASEVLLLSEANNPERATLPAHDSVPYWQGSGADYALSSTGVINVKTASGNTVEVPETAVIIGAVFDRDAVGVANLDRRVTTAYNARAEFYTNFYKMDAGYYNDLGENFVVFFIGEDE